jgi:molecular chaperone Hsp33
MQHTYNNTDISVPFLLPRLSLRGRLVRLQAVNEKILSQHDYPGGVEKVLSELLAGATVLAGLLKYEGVFTLQTKSSGPLQLAVVDVTHEGNVRGYAQFKPEIQSEDFKDLMHKGHLVFTVDQNLKIERYQGIVTLNHETLPQALEHYFTQSEQLETKMLIAYEKTKEGMRKSAALLLQQMPTEKPDLDAWSYVESIFSTLLPQEFLDFSINYEQLLYRLFHEAGVTTFDPQPLQAKCRCSEERIKAFLAAIDEDEREHLLEKGPLKMTCEFCNHVYEFDRKDLMTVH